jgi:hypothetical protein
MTESIPVFDAEPAIGLNCLALSATDGTCIAIVVDGGRAGRCLHHQASPDGHNRI